ncbi:MAG: pilus assembly PilX N-terminal domain-containing protein [Nitrospirae bacterium]|nr:pilus assembly PilX N-terminal domain-containing protein [Nitrospirota bacterium]
MKRTENEKGFALVSALVVLLILMALSTLMYTITTRDVRVSTRMVGEYKAFAATEAGIHALISATNTNAGSMTNYTLSSTQVDAATDPDTYYSISTSTISGVPVSMPMAGYEIGGSNSKNYGYSVTNKTVTGTNTRYNSSMSVDVGIAYGPIEISTGQPAAGG